MTSSNGLAFIFPAFINEYPGNPFMDSRELHDAFYRLLETAASLADPGLSSFDFNANPFHDDEIRTQYITFIYSCSACNILEKHKLKPAFSAGYSMGLYAALVQAKVITFEQGLLLIRNAYDSIRECILAEKYGMCSVIGLSREDIENIIEGNRWRIKIVNRNSPFAFVLSGQLDDIHSFRDAAKEEGALNIHLLNVTLPYHSQFLEGTKTRFGEFLHSVEIKKPETRIISLIDQRIIYEEPDIRNELVENLFTPLNWYKTQTRLLDDGVRLFIECGPGKNLVKNAKFIEGEFKFYSVCDFIKKLNTEYTD